MDLSAPVWDRFWYPVAFADEVANGPIARTALGERLVLRGALNGAVLRSTYPNGRVHQIVTAATPVGPDRLRLVARTHVDALFIEGP